MTTLHQTPPYRASYHDYFYRASHYVLVTGPYDAIFVGPFSTTTAARRYARTVDANVFDCTIMTPLERERSERVFGPLPLEAPPLPH